MSQKVKRRQIKLFVSIDKLSILFEPWATHIYGNKGDEITIEAYGEIEANLNPDIDLWFVEDGVTISAWRTALFNVFKNGEELPKVWY
jgi:hypothetical protein